MLQLHSYSKPEKHLPIGPFESQHVSSSFGFWTPRWQGMCITLCRTGSTSELQLKCFQLPFLPPLGHHTYLLGWCRSNARSKNSLQHATARIEINIISRHKNHYNLLIFANDMQVCSFPFLMPRTSCSRFWHHIDYEGSLSGSGETSEDTVNETELRILTCSVSAEKYRNLNLSPLKRVALQVEH